MYTSSAAIAEIAQFLSAVLGGVISVAYYIRAQLSLNAEQNEEQIDPSLLLTAHVVARRERTKVVVHGAMLFSGYAVHVYLSHREVMTEEIYLLAYVLRSYTFMFVSVWLTKDTFQDAIARHKMRILRMKRHLAEMELAKQQRRRADDN